MAKVLILGVGYTGSRVAAILTRSGHDVTAIRRSQIDFTQPHAIHDLRQLTPLESVVLHSIPSLANHADAALLQGLEGKATRVVYLSTTGVYGAATHVDEATPIAPRTGREQARADTEAAVQRGPWQSLVLRPAAIYGPDRGVHISMAQGLYTLHGDGSNYISRIHVDDLARLTSAALLSALTGAYPVADLQPCTSREIAEYCATRFHLSPPVTADQENVPATRRNNRQVDGRAIFQLLGVQLKYPSYVEGLAGEKLER